jgi:hypothetical protein
LRGAPAGARAAAPAALALALCATAIALPARADSGACMDSLDALAGVRYVAALDSAVGPLDRTTFCYFDPKYRYTYTWTWACHGDSMDGTHATLEITRRQYVRLPGGGPDSAAAWQRLRPYQHDRVAVTQDERPMLLAKWLASHLPPLHARTKCGANVPGAFADHVVGEAITARYAAVIDLVRGNNDALAAATHQGAVPLRDREAFFAGLYDRAALVRANFPFLADAESLLTMPRYVNALRPRCDGEVLR